MKLLFDSCVWAGARELFSEAKHDAIWAADWPEDPGDDEILTRAVTEARVLVTLDKDFGELAVHRGLRHCGIIRLVDIPARQQAPVCLRVIDRYAKELEAGSLVTVEPGRVRVRAPERDA